jgi:hypothetical protein
LGSGAGRLAHEPQGTERHAPFRSSRFRGSSGRGDPVTDAVYVLFANAVVKRRRLPAATWSSVWSLLSSFAVISSNRWVYVLFAATGSFIGAYATMTYLHPGPTYPPPPVGSAPD